MCSLGGVDKAKTSEGGKVVSFSAHTHNTGVGGKKFFKLGRQRNFPFLRRPQKTMQTRPLPKTPFLSLCVVVCPRRRRGGKGFFANEFLEAKKSCFSTKRP